MITNSNGYEKAYYYLKAFKIVHIPRTPYSLIYLEENEVSKLITMKKVIVWFATLQNKLISVKVREIKLWQKINSSL